MTTDDEGSMSNGGEDAKRQKNESEVKEVDAGNQPGESNGPESTSKKLPTCKTRLEYTPILAPLVYTSTNVNRLWLSFIIWSSYNLHQCSIAVFLNSVKPFPISKYFLSTAGFVQLIVKGIFGCVAAVACGMLYAIYLSTYHDRKFWFSTRQVGVGIL